MKFRMKGGKFRVKTPRSGKSSPPKKKGLGIHRHRGSPIGVASLTRTRIHSPRRGKGGSRAVARLDKRTKKEVERELADITRAAQQMQEPVRTPLENKIISVIKNFQSFNADAVANAIAMRQDISENEDDPELVAEAREQLLILQFLQNDGREHGYPVGAWDAARIGAQAHRVMNAIQTARRAEQKAWDAGARARIEAMYNKQDMIIREKLRDRVTLNEEEVLKLRNELEGINQQRFPNQQGVSLPLQHRKFGNIIQSANELNQLVGAGIIRKSEFGGFGGKYLIA